MHSACPARRRWREQIPTRWFMAGQGAASTLRPIPWVWFSTTPTSPVNTPAATATDLTVSVTGGLTPLTTAYWKGGLTGATSVMGLRPMGALRATGWRTPAVRARVSCPARRPTSSSPIRRHDTPQQRCDAGCGYDHPQSHAAGFVELRESGRRWIHADDHPGQSHERCHPRERRSGCEDQPQCGARRGADLGATRRLAVP